MISKAVIPIAGLGTRLGPIAKAVPKAMLPLPAGGAHLLPVLHWICAEAATIVQELMLIVSPHHVPIVRAYLDAAAGSEPALPERVELTVQEMPAGFGDAVRLAEGFVGDGPFMVMLGDHVYTADSAPCAAQIGAAHAKTGGVATIGVQSVDAAELQNVGVVGGEPIGGRTYHCRAFVEKPDLQTAQSSLITPGLADGQFLAHCGLYIFDREIFDCLTELASGRQGAGGGGELQLADAQSLLLARHAERYLLFRIDGRAWDVGTPAGYVKAFSAFATRAGL